MATERERKQDYEDAYEQSYSGWHDFLTEAHQDVEFYCSAQFTEDDYQKAQRSGRSLYAFNRIKRQVNLVSGYEQRNRHILKIGPIGRDDDVTASQHTALVMQQMQSADGYDWLSLAFKHGSLLSGSNLLELYRDRFGQVQFGRRWHNSFLLDPTLTRPDLSDCSYIVTGQWVRQDKCQELVPEAYNLRSIKRIPVQGGPNRWPQLPHKPSSDDEPNPLRMYEEFWERSTRFVPTVMERLTGREMSWRQFVRRIGGDERRARWAVKNITMPNGTPAMSRFEKPIREVKLTIYVDGEQIWTGLNPLGLDDYNFVWLCGDFLPELDRPELKLQSFSRVLADPQKARNRRLNQIIDMMESQIQTGRVFRENLLVDKEQAYVSGQGVVIEVKDEASTRPLQDVFMQLPAPDIPAGMFNLLDVLDREDIQASGLNEEIMGSDDAEVPGILHSYRTAQALTGLQGLFATYRQAKRRLGRLLVKYNQLNTPPDEVQRVIGKAPAPDFYAPDLGRFDCTPTEGQLTDNQQHLWYMELKQLRSEFPDMLQYIPASMLLKAAPVQYKEELMRAVQQAEQQNSMMMQRQMETQETMNRMAMAQAESDLARAQEDRADARLSGAKTITEMAKLADDASIDRLDRLLRLLEIQIDAQRVQVEARKVQLTGRKEKK